MKWILRTSRPRFWGYLAGTFAVGWAAGAESVGDFWTPTFWLWLAYFTLPANLLVYGINDISDRDTDALNAKKDGYENRHKSSKTRPLVWWILLLHLPVVPLLLITPIAAQVAWAGWLILSLSYSLPPVRLKARPFLDSVSNVLYTCPALIGYWSISTEPSDWVAFVGIWSMMVGMHAYSAIPDIPADTKAGLSTTATTLGKHRTLMYVWALWMTTFAITLQYSLLAGILGMGVYTTIIFTSWKSNSTLFAVYKRLPVINTLMGMIAFWYFFGPLAVAHLSSIISL